MATTTDPGRPLGDVDEWWQQHGVDEESTVGVFVRSYAPPPANHHARRRLLNTLSFAEDRDRIRGYEFRVVGSELCLCEDCRPTYRDSDLLETVARICAWTDGQLKSTGFRTRTLHNGTTAERHRTLVPPETAVAVTREDALVGVFPCDAGGETYALDAFLADLREAVTGEGVARDELGREGNLASVDSREA